MRTLTVGWKAEARDNTAHALATQQLLGTELKATARGKFVATPNGRSSNYRWDKSHLAGQTVNSEWKFSCSSF